MKLVKISRGGIRMGIQLAYAENRDRNPAYLFATDKNDTLALHKFEIDSGDPSFISISDGDTILDILCTLSEAFYRWGRKVPSIVIAGKHGNPCGAAIDWDNPVIALRKALLGNTVAVMGGEVITNFPINDELGEELLKPAHGLNVGRDNWGLDIIYAPSFSENTISILGKREKRRLLSNFALTNPVPNEATWTKRPVRGGYLEQRAPSFYLTPDAVATWVGNPLSDYDFATLLVAWVVCYRASSNTVALAKDNMLIGLGCGQQDRIECVRLCLSRANQAGHDAKESLFVSDAFFPYAESVSSEISFQQLRTMANIIHKIKEPEKAGGKIALRELAKVASMITAIDNREGPELLIDAGCKGGLVTADGKNLEEVKNLFKENGLSVAFVDAKHRGFSKH